MRALALTVLVGCSFAHVKGPPDTDCTFNFEHPTTDAVMAGIFAGLAATMIIGIETVQDEDGRRSTSDELAFAAGYVLLLPAAIFATSAAVGFRRVIACRKG